MSQATAPEQFLKEMGATLQLSSQERTAIEGIDIGTWLLWAVSTLSGERAAGIDAEKLSKHVPPATHPLLGKEARFREETMLDFRKGELAVRAYDLYHRGRANVSARNRFQRLSAACAGLLFEVGRSIDINSRLWQDNVPAIPHTALLADVNTGQLFVRFPNHNRAYFPVPEPVGSVVTYGPGLSGGAFYEYLVGKAKAVHFVSGGLPASFANAWGRLMIASTGRAVAQRRALDMPLPDRPWLNPREAFVPEATFYDRGIAGSLDQVSHNARRKKQPVDVVVMSGVHMAGPEECLAGVDGAKELLSEGGLLVVMGPSVSLEGEAGLDVVAPRAYQRLGKPVLAGECGVIGQMVDTTLPNERPAEFAIYQK